MSNLDGIMSPYFPNNGSGDQALLLEKAYAKACAADMKLERRAKEVLDMIYTIESAIISIKKEFEAELREREAERMRQRMRR